MPFSKKTWLGLTMAALVAGSAGSVWAVDPAGTQPAQEQPGQVQPQVQEAAEEVLTAEKAVEQALKTNSGLAAFRLDVRTADINARLVKERTSEIDDDFVETLEAAQQKYILSATEDMKRKINALALKARESQTKYDAQKAFYDWVNALAGLELAQQSLKRAELQEKVAQAAFAAGTRAKSDVLQAQASVAAAQAQLAAAQTAAEMARLQLNRVMGVDLGKRWVLQKDFKVLEPQPITLEEAIAKALSQRVEIVQAQEEKKLAEKNYELISKYLAASTYQGQMQKAAVQKAELAIEDARRLVTMQVTQARAQVDSARAQIEAYRKAREAAEESYRLTKLRFENGLATTLEVIQAEEELSSRENQYQQALHQYNLAVLALDTAMGN